jgi:glycerol-3-phosphate acyltransferase PlsY
MGLELMGWILVIGGYLLGSLLPAEWIVRWRTGQTPQELSENPGGAGTWRLVGPWAAVLVLMFDLAKGALPLALAQRMELHQGWLIATAVAPIVGHSWPFYKGFRGGQGLGAATGALFWLAWSQMIPGYLLGGTLALWRRWVPFVPIIAFPAGLILMWLAEVPSEDVHLALAVMLMVALRQTGWVWQHLKRGSPQKGR